jgi:hypothetical protein
MGVKIIKFLASQDEMELNYFDYFLLALYDLSLLIFFDKISAKNFVILILISLLILFGLVYLHNKLIKMLKDIV